MEKGQSFQQMRMEQPDIHMQGKKKNLDTFFTPVTKLNQNGSQT